MRAFIYLDGDIPVLRIAGFTFRLSNKEFDNLFNDMKMIARNQNV